MCIYTDIDIYMCIYIHKYFLSPYIWICMHRYVFLNYTSEDPKQIASNHAGSS